MARHFVYAARAVNHAMVYWQRDAWHGGRELLDARLVARLKCSILVRRCEEKYAETRAVITPFHAAASSGNCYPSSYDDS